MVFNGAQFHMLLNHLPVVGLTGMVVALIVAWFVPSRDIRRFVLLSTAVAGLTALPAYWTGEPAEDVVEKLPGVSKEMIHEHEELAEKATILSVVTAVVAALAFFLQQRRPETLNKGLGLVLLLSLVSATVMGLAAHEGGKIRHPEIVPGTPESMPAQGGKEHEGG